MAGHFSIKQCATVPAPSLPPRTFAPYPYDVHHPSRLTTIRSGPSFPILLQLGITCPRNDFFLRPSRPSSIARHEHHPSLTVPPTAFSEPTSPQWVLQKRSQDHQPHALRGVLGDIIRAPPPASEHTYRAHKWRAQSHRRRARRTWSRRAIHQTQSPRQGDSVDGRPTDRRYTSYLPIRPDQRGNPTSSHPRQASGALKKVTPPPSIREA